MPATAAKDQVSDSARVSGTHNLDLVLGDLQMMAMTYGQERTEAEFAELFAGAGFRLDRVVPTDTNVSIIEATPKLPTG